MHCGPVGCCPGDSSQSCSWVAKRKTSERCYCGPARHTGRWFCLPLSSSSGICFPEEQCCSVLITFWPPPTISSPSPPWLFLTFSLSPLVHWPVSWRLCEGWGFTGRGSDECSPHQQPNHLTVPPQPPPILIIFLFSCFLLSLHFCFSVPVAKK